VLSGYLVTDDVAILSIQAIWASLIREGARRLKFYVGRACSD
jgi:hypothetical protein